MCSQSLRTATPFFLTPKLLLLLLFCYIAPSPCLSQLFRVGRVVMEECFSELADFSLAGFTNNIETQETVRLRILLGGYLTLPITPLSPPAPPAMKLLLYLSQSCTERQSAPPGGAIIFIVF